MAGSIGDKEKGQYKTSKACPFPEEFCDYVGEFIAKPVVHFDKRGEIRADDVGNAIVAVMSVGPRVSMQLPTADQYLTHLPKHPGCKACMFCRVQRKHCRDHNKGRQRKLADVVETEKDDANIELPNQDVPKVFGDLVIWLQFRNEMEPNSNG